MIEESCYTRDPPQSTAPADVTADTDGGNIKLNLAGMAVTRVSANTGGGNMDVLLPDNPASLCGSAKTGAGNVEIQIPSAIEAKIHATSGPGKESVNTK